MKKYLITGGAGFIGANFILRFLERNPEASVINLDCLSYAGDIDRLSSIAGDGRYSFVKGDICDAKVVNEVLETGVDAIVHFAAESHVDRSIEDSLPFEAANVRGVVNLLDAAKRHGVEKFVHISTDEVYGELGETGSFFEDTPLKPNSPYSASKASGDMFAQAYHHTFGMPIVIIRPSNNYGPWQYPEKLIPVVINMALDDKPVPVYARGENIREWLYVDDCADGVMDILQHGKVGEAYNLGSGHERRNIDVVKAILSILDKPESLIKYVEDRPGHDFRYSLNADKIKSEVGWRAGTAFEVGLEATVRWYVDNQAWWRKFTD